MVSNFTVSCTLFKDNKPKQMHISCACFQALPFVWVSKRKIHLAFTVYKIIIEKRRDTEKKIMLSKTF